MSGATNDALALARAAVEADTRGSLPEAIALYEKTVAALLANMHNSGQPEMLQRKTDEYMERIEVLRRQLPTPAPLSTKACPTCTYQNAASASTCEMCSTPLGECASQELACPTCTFQNPPEATSCKMCSTALAAASAQSPESQSAAAVAEVVKQLDLADRELRAQAAAAADARAAERRREKAAAQAAEEARLREAEEERKRQAVYAQREEAAAQQRAEQEQKRRAAEAAAAQAAARVRLEAEAAEEQAAARAKEAETARAQAAARARLQAQAAEEERRQELAAEAAARQREKQAEDSKRAAAAAEAKAVADAVQAKRAEQQAVRSDLFTQERKHVDEAVIHQKALKERDFALAKNHNKCKDCRSGFSLLRWRNRCQYCGLSLCSSCLKKTAVLPACFGHGATRQAVCTGCSNKLIGLHHAVLEQLQGLSGQALHTSQQDDFTLVNTSSRAPARATQPSPKRPPLSSAAAAFQQACIQPNTPEPSPVGADAEGDLPLGFARSDLVEVSGVPLPAFRTGEVQHLSPNSSGGLSRSSSFVSEDELPLGFSRPDLKQRRAEAGRLALPQFREDAPLSPAQRIREDMNSSVGSVDEADSILPLGFHRHDLNARRVSVEAGPQHSPDNPTTIPGNVWR
eukprot:TRINITY_DN38205_c0_g1_i3.p1 TRINITY_DN38205_c0_g1~~TRINITY_DN38205_c0_g1_i3.p1  ORF type:complete len:633 (-),score=194.09 TRINITY_DN38205_c0_g1_i3:125-2023(-)